jgi:hypothetical protein
MKIYELVIGADLLVEMVYHHQELAKGTLRSILRQAGINFDEFVSSKER